MAKLEGLAPEKVFTYFEEISNIPRGTGNCAGIADYLVSFAEKKGLASTRDAANNVVIYAPATEGYENAGPVILQGHVDMVCAKVENSAHNFDTDPIDLIVEDDFIRANGTTLGADDGIAVAYMLAILDDDSLAHPALECLFTTDEETGLIGASALDASVLKGRRLINLDSENEGVLTAGCAGGVRVDSVLKLTRGTIKGLPVSITLRGLLGGHSGEMIDRGRANACKLLGRFLYELDSEFTISIADITGGEKDNAIPALAKAHIVIDEDDLAGIREAGEHFMETISREYAGTDDEPEIVIESGRVHKVSVLDPDSQDRVLAFLMQTPYGVLHMQGLDTGLLQTSVNLGIIRTGGEQFVATSLIRSSLVSERDAVAEQIVCLANILGGKAQTRDGYPAWEFAEESPLRDTMYRIFGEMYENEAIVTVIHGGLECGLFYDKIKGLDAVSIGPDLFDVHTPNEKLSISSVQRTWAYLTAVLSALT